MHVPSSQAETSSPLRRTRGVVRSSAHQTPLPLRYSTGGAGVPATTRRVPKHTAGQPPATAHSTAERASTSLSTREAHVLSQGMHKGGVQMNRG